MPDVRTNTVPLEFADLTKNQKRLVRKLAWENLTGEARFIVIIPWVTGCFGALIGIVVGVVLGRLAFPNHQFRCFAICAGAGTGIGAWVGRFWLERECQTHYKNVIRENENRISQVV